MMDSGNSGSMQSSSGGDEEYDSRTGDSLSFFNQSGRRVVGQTMGLESYSSSTFPSISNLLPQQQQPPPSLSLLPNHPPPTLFDSQPHSLASFSHSLQNQNQNQNQNPLYNTTSNSNLDLLWSRSGPNFTNPGTFSTQQSPPIQQSPSSSMALPSVNDGNGGRPVQRGTDQQPPTAAPPKNSRKRTRASRRAPTTVLTTDTSNFRQMVQEFTGIPAQPFSAAASPYSRRLDLFGGGGVGGGGVSGLMRSSQLDTLGPLYPFRPSAQKFQPNNLSTFLAAAANSSGSVSTTNNTISTSASTTSGIGGPSNPGYQTASSDLGLVPKQQNQQSRDMMNMQDQFMAYQSLLQQPNVSMFGSKSSDINQELGINQEQGIENNPGGFQSQNQQIGLENVSSRNNEGTLESWIIPSD